MSDVSDLTDLSDLPDLPVVSFRVAGGEVSGFMGPNGAGKPAIGFW